MCFFWFSTVGINNGGCWREQYGAWLSRTCQAAWDLNNMKHDMLMCAWTSQRRSKELFSLLSDFIIYCWHEWFRNREPILYIHGSESRTLQIGWLSFPALLKWRILDFWGVFADPIPHTIPHPACFCSRYDPSLCEESHRVNLHLCALHKVFLVHGG
jgi:hypothetical protein